MIFTREVSVDYTRFKSNANNQQLRVQAQKVALSVYL